MASETFSIDSITGDVKWENPVLQGEYNIAFVVDEWRNGVKVGSVMRDMQILIGACNNNPPIITAPDEACAIAGKDPLVFDISATDPDNNAVLITASGGPFEFNSNPAAIVPDPGAGTPTANTTFYWSATCDQIRKTSYAVLFKARDVHPEVNLTALHTTAVSVAGPPIEALTAEPLGVGINLQWNTYECPSAKGFYVYRSNGSTGFVPNPCQTGVPPGIGFQRIAVIEGIDLTTYRDEDGGQGLTPGVNYCYVVSAYFEDGAESMVSNEACAALKRDLPIMTHVSNDSLNLNSGRVLVAWSKPTELDTVQYPSPYQYTLYRNLPDQSEPSLVYTGIGLNDTLFTDVSVNLNELESAVSYRVLLKSLPAGDVGFSKSASSVLLEITPTDEALQLSWTPDVPWQNDSTEVFRFDAANNEFVKIGVTFGNIFLDEGLQNEVSYLYYVRTIGSLGEDFVHPIVNYSQLIAASPIDNVPPCPPEIIVETNCGLIQNTVILDQIFDSCSFDVRRYRVYYAPTASAEFLLIDSIPAGQTSYLHEAIDFVTGCYYVNAVDSTGNISTASNIVCVDYDVCPVLDLPNVFTPNADQFNDLFVPIGYPEINPNANIERIELVIFNRWGNLVFETNNPAIEWDGKNQRTGTDCAEGTYFYVCEVYFQSLEGLVQQRLQGSVTIVR
jgi:gliding motility-associated-like protein